MKICKGTMCTFLAFYPIKMVCGSVRKMQMLRNGQNRCFCVLGFNSPWGEH